MIICIYALVSPAPGRLNLTGIAGEKLQVMTTNRLAAVIGELRRLPAPSVKNLRRYATVIEAIAARVPASLPARFTTTVADRDELAFILRSRSATLRQRLRAVRGRAQITIRFIVPPDRTPSARRPASGTEYLHRLASARAVPGFEPIREAVRRFVKDERVDKRGDVVTVNHLVKRTAVDRYRTAIVRAAQARDLRLIVTGPLAPYAFADNW